MQFCSWPTSHLGHGAAVGAVTAGGEAPTALVDLRIVVVSRLVGRQVACHPGQGEVHVRLIAGVRRQGDLQQGRERGFERATLPTPLQKVVSPMVLKEFMAVEQ